MTSALPQRTISWYGDDFTGSTDALEVLATYLPSVLFLRRPDDHFFSRFSHCSAFGLAGSSRSQTPEWMNVHLEAAFAWLRSLQTAVCHYKVCSTFDSSPRIGSIGRALEIGRRVFGSQFVPIVVGAPALKRYTAFGNLFGTLNGTVHRIDRHPVMKRHPVTPMTEADLRIHLADQTHLSVGLIDLLQLESSTACEQYIELGAREDAVLIDVINEGALRKAGRLLWSAQRQPFVVGSSGVEYALAAYWQERGLLPQQPSSPLLPATDRIVVLSGSCSPVTAQQINYAERAGFKLIRLDVDGLASGERVHSAADEAIAAAVTALDNGDSVVLFTAASAEDRIETFASADEQQRFRQILGVRSGEILNAIVDRTGVRRVVVAGGDTSSHAGQQLSIDALTFRAKVATGAPLCRTWSLNPLRQDLDIVFKGGQTGGPDFFELALTGRASSPR